MDVKKEYNNIFLRLFPFRLKVKTESDVFKESDVYKNLFNYYSYFFDVALNFFSLRFR